MTHPALARPLLLAALALALSACGGRDDAAPAAGADPAPGAEMGETIDDLAEAGLDCPPDVRDGLAGPDILGVRVGMSTEEALGTVRCELGEDAVVKTENRWLDNLDTYGAALGVQFFSVRQGDHRACDFAREWQECDGGQKWGHVDETVEVATPGAPGQEAAMVVWRTQSFRDGAKPAAKAVLDALVAKYGQPQRSESTDDPWAGSSGRHTLTWVLDPAGRPISEANPLFNRCVNGVMAGSGGVSWAEGCGVNISARVLLDGQNPGLAMELSTALVDQGRLLEHVEAMKAALAEAGNARREAEVQAAGEAGDVRL